MLDITTFKYLIPGPSGNIETAIDFSRELCLKDELCKIALVTHPHPLFGGTFTNKVSHTISRSFASLGYVSIRPNFRGVGASDGKFTDGIGEQEDMLALLSWISNPQNWKKITENYKLINLKFSKIKPQKLVLAGFSFGSYVLNNLAAKAQNTDCKLELETAPGFIIERLILVAPPVTKWKFAHISQTILEKTLVIHGQNDTNISLVDALSWAQIQDLAINVIPAADHFFHSKLHILKKIILQNLH